MNFWPINATLQVLDMRHPQNPRTAPHVRAEYYKSGSGLSRASGNNLAMCCAAVGHGPLEA